MKRWKKIVLLIFSFNILFFTVESKKREAEAFALTTVALAVGGLATLAVGGYVVSQAVTSDLGQKIINNLTGTGKNYKEYVTENLVTGVTKMHIDNHLRGVIQKTLQDEVATVPTSSQVAFEPEPYIKTNIGGGSITFDTGFTNLKAGELIRFTGKSVVARWPVYVGLSQNTASYQSYIERGYYQSVGTYDTNAPLTEDIDIVVELKKDSSKLYFMVERVGYEKRDIEFTNLKIERLSVADSPEHQRYLQYQNVPRLAGDIGNQVTANLSQPTYEIDNTKDIVGATALSDIQVQMEEITENTSQTNSFIQKLITAVGAIPSAIMSGINSAFSWLQGLLTNIWNAILGIPSAVAGAMSGLWEDAGMVWSGIKDTTVAINNWLNNVLTGALDGISSGIDNLTNGLSNMWEGIEAGLVNIGNKIGTGVSTGVADLTGVIDKIGSIPMDLIGLIIPSDWSGVTDRVDSLMFNVAENPFKEFMDSLSAVFAKRKSIFDLRITLYGKVYPIVPLVLKPALDIARNFLTGAVMLISLTLVYVRAKGISWWK